MQFGYPSKINIDDLYSQLEPNLQPHRHLDRRFFIGKVMCCRILLLSAGFQLGDFKLAKSEFHIRPGKSQLLDQMYNGVKKFSADLALKFDKGVKAYKFRIFYIRLKFLSARQYFSRFFHYIFF